MPSYLRTVTFFHPPPPPTVHTCFPLSRAKVCFGGQMKDVSSLGRSPEAYICNPSTQSRWASQWEPKGQGTLHCQLSDPTRLEDWARTPEPTHQSSVDPVGVSLIQVPRASTRDCSPDCGPGPLGEEGHQRALCAFWSRTSYS